MVRLAVIKKEKCKPDLCGWLCMKQCPINMTDSDCIYEDTDKKAGIDEILCTGCGICPKICPFDAISIINLPELKNTTPIHQYGLNGFRIFDLPLIQDKSITGIIGKNGIGKSSVINVLSNSVKANFAKFGGEKLADEDYFKFLNDLFKGTALQNYFNKLEKGEIKVAYKPQQIVNIPKVYSGPVKDLLLKINSDEYVIEGITKKLNIFKILQRDIKVLSGGELQRVAIAACLLKEGANFYVLDEVTNYLDIFERLNTARVIKDTSEGKTALLIEHDLVVLDYMTDFINIMYGQAGAYGMLTSVKTSKVGINIFLDGYSKDENVRFRDKPISFDKESITESKKFKEVAKWSEKDLRLGEFKLNIKAGSVMEGEVMGIIGRNALGKTTFINDILEEGFGPDVVISSKPQMIPRGIETVMELLMAHYNYTDNFYQLYVLDPLNVKPLLEKTTESLSGGELQRVAIANTLLKEAHVYLLDEPTAFLDIEEKLKIAKMLKNFVMLKDKSAFIIDHDLVFMDYLSDRLLVFEGSPGVNGVSNSPLSMRDGMNLFLKGLNITFRRDDANKRPRVNKLDSVKDQEQKKSGEYYYS
jgi:ATP-binding cassette subfamily E protein 1